MEGMQAINGAGQKMSGNMYTEAVYTKEGFAIPIEWLTNDNKPNNPNEGMLRGRIGELNADDLVKGAKALVDTGLVTGTLDIDQVFTFNGELVIPVDKFDMADGSKGLKVFESLGNATAADLVKGKTAYTEAGKITGTLEVTGGEPSYTLQIMTENATADAEYIMYYAPGSSEKTRLTLTTALQSFTSGDFICLNKTGDNISTTIRFLDSNGAPLVSVSVALNPKYVINASPNGWNIINIGAIKRDYPNVAQIIVGYLN